MLRAQIAFASSRGSDAPPLLLEAARRLEPLDATLARDTYLEALSAAIFAGRLASGTGLRDVAEAARAAPRPRSAARPPICCSTASALLITEGDAAGGAGAQAGAERVRRERRLHRGGAALAVARVPSPP